MDKTLTKPKHNLEKEKEKEKEKEIYYFLKKIIFYEVMSKEHNQERSWGIGLGVSNWD